MLSLASSQYSDAGAFSPSSIRRGTGAKSMSRMHQTMRLPDGRQLGYAEYGVPNGRPVMLMHSASGSRLERHPDETVVERCGIRLIIPDRPGIGMSDSERRSTLLSWAADVEHLADHLALGKFGIIGFSLGAAFGLACAYALKARIHRLVLVSSVAPPGSRPELGGISAPIRLFVSYGKHAGESQATGLLSSAGDADGIRPLGL